MSGNGRETERTGGRTDREGLYECMTWVQITSGRKYHAIERCQAVVKNAGFPFVLAYINR